MPVQRLWETAPFTLHPPPASNEEVSTQVNVVPGTRETSTGDSQEKVNGASAVGHCAAIESRGPSVSLRIVPVKARSRDSGPVVETYAFLDVGSKSWRTQETYTVLFDFNKC